MKKTTKVDFLKSYRKHIGQFNARSQKIKNQIYSNSSESLENNHNNTIPIYKYFFLFLLLTSTLPSSSGQNLATNILILRLTFDIFLKYLENSSGGFGLDEQDTAVGCYPPQSLAQGGEKITCGIVYPSEYGIFKKCLAENGISCSNLIEEKYTGKKYYKFTCENRNKNNILEIIDYKCSNIKP